MADFQDEPPDGSSGSNKLLWIGLAALGVMACLVPVCIFAALLIFANSSDTGPIIYDLF